MDKKEKIVKIAENAGIIRPMDVEKEGIPREYLYRLVKDGKIEKIGRGLYALPKNQITEHLSIIEVVKRVPKAVISLISALHFHNLTTQVPNEVWITLEKASWKPNITYPPLNVTYVSKEAYRYGVEEHVINGVKINVYSPSKTVADCFKFRNKVGLDVAIEALKETWRKKKASMDDITEAAKICRVSKIMRPYLEAIGVLGTIV